MAGKITIECPGCSAKLNLSDRSKLGKKIKCPKCQEVFMPEAPDEDEVEDFDDDMDDEPKSKTPLKRSGGGQKRSGGKSSKGGSSGGGSNVVLIGVGAAAVVLLGGIGLIASGVFTGKAPPLNPNATPAMASAAPATAPAAPQSTAGAPGSMNPTMAHSQMPSPSVTPRPQASSGATAVTPVEKAFGLKWMPPDFEFIIHAKVSEIWAAPLLKQPLSNPAVTKWVDENLKTSNVEPSDIESMTIGIGNITESFSAGVAIGMAGAAGGRNPGGPPNPALSPENQRFVGIVKSKKGFDPKSLLIGPPGSATKEKNGKQYLELPNSPKTAIWLAEPKTLIVATIKELHEIFEKGETQTPRKEFASIDHLPHLVIACAIPDLLSDANTSNTPNPLAGNPMFEAFKPYSVRLASIGINIKGGFDLQISALSGTDDGSKKIKSDLETTLSQVKSQFDLYKQTAPPLLADLGEMLLTNLKVEEKNQIVKVSTSIPDSAQAQLEQLPPVLMMMAMTGGLPGMGGPGGGSPFGPGGGQAGGLGGMKQPGETEPIASAKVEGLPEGVTITAKTAWNPFPSIAADGTSSTTMQIMIDASGDGIDTICASMGAVPKTMKLDVGGRLKPAKAISFSNADPQKTFAHFDPADQFSMDHPLNILRVKLVAEAPPPAATKIDVLEGSFKFLTSANVQEMTIEDAPKRAKRPLTGPEYKAAELKLRRSKTGTIPGFLTIWCGKDHFVGQVKGMPDGLMSITESEKDQTVQRLYSNSQDGTFPDDLQISFKLYSKVEEHEVTFRFENVPLPAKELKPMLQ